MGIGSFPEVEGAGSGVIRPTSSSVEIPERAKLYLYSNSVSS